MGLFQFEIRENEESLDGFDSDDENVDDDDIEEDNTSANETYYSDESVSRRSHPSEHSRSQHQNTGSADHSYSTRGGDDQTFDSRGTGSQSRYSQDTRSFYSNHEPDHSNHSYSTRGSYRSRSPSHSQSRSDSRSYTSDGSETYYSEEQSRHSSVPDSQRSRSYSSRGRHSHYSGGESSRRSSVDSWRSHRSSYSRDRSLSQRDRRSERSTESYVDDDYTSRGSYSSGSRSRSTASRSHSQRERQRRGGSSSGGSVGSDDASHASPSSGRSHGSRRSHQSSTTRQSAQSPGSHHSTFQSSFASQISKAESLFMESANLFSEPLFEGEEDELEHEPTPSSSPTNSAQSSHHGQQQQQQQPHQQKPLVEQSIPQENVFLPIEKDSISQNNPASVDPPLGSSTSLPSQQDVHKSSNEHHSTNSDGLLRSSMEEENFFEVSTSFENQTDSSFGVFGKQEDFGSSTPNVFGEGEGGFPEFGETDHENNAAWGSSTFHPDTPSAFSKLDSGFQQSRNIFEDDDNPLFDTQPDATTNLIPVGGSNADQQTSSSSKLFQQSTNQFGKEDDPQDSAWGSTVSDRLGASRTSRTQHSALDKSSNTALLQFSDNKIGGDTAGSQEFAGGSTASAPLSETIKSPTGSHRSFSKTPSIREGFQESPIEFPAVDSQEFGWGSTTSDGFAEGSRVSHSRRSASRSTSRREILKSSDKFEGEDSREFGWGSSRSPSLREAIKTPTGSRRSVTKTPSIREGFQESHGNFPADDGQEFGWGSTTSDGFLEGSRVSHSRRSASGTTSRHEILQSSNKFDGEDSREFGGGSTTSASLGGSRRVSHSRRSTTDTRSSLEGFEMSNTFGDDGQDIVPGSTTLDRLGQSRTSQGERADRDSFGTSSSPQAPPKSNQFGSDNVQEFSLEEAQSKSSREPMISPKVDRQPVFPSSSPANFQQSGGQDFGWESTRSDRSKGSRMAYGRSSSTTFSPKSVGTPTVEADNGQNSVQDLKTPNLGGSRLSQNEDQASPFMSPAASLAELELSNLLGYNSHQTIGSRSGHESLANAITHEMTQATDSTRRSVSSTNPKPSQNSMVEDQMSQGDGSRSDGIEQRRGNQSKVFAEAEFPNDMDFGSFSVAPIDTKAFSTEDFGEDLFGDSSSRSASVAFRESSEFQHSNQEATWGEKNTFDDDDDAFFEQHSNTRPFDDFDFSTREADDDLPDEGRQEKGPNFPQQQRKRSDQASLGESAIDSFSGDQSRAKKSTDEQEGNVEDDSFAVESRSFSNSHSRSTRGTSSRHSRGFQSGHSRRSRSERSRRSRRRDSLATAVSSKHSSLGSLAESVSVVSKGSKQSRNSSKSSTLSSKKNRPSISEYLPEIRTQSKSGTKSIDSRSETEPSLGLVDVFGASALGPTISEEASSTNDEYSERSNESNASRQSASSSKRMDAHSVAAKDAAEVDDSANHRSEEEFAAREPGSFSTASDHPSARQRLRSSLRSGDHSGATLDQGNDQIEGDPSRIVTFSEKRRDSGSSSHRSDSFGESIPLKETETVNSEQSKGHPHDSFSDDFMSPRGPASFSNNSGDLYDLTEKSESSRASRESDSHTPSNVLDYSSSKQSLSSAAQESHEDFRSSPRRESHSAHSDTPSIPTSSLDQISQHFSPIDRESNHRSRHKNSVHHVSNEQSSPVDTGSRDGLRKKYSSRSTSTRSQDRSTSSIPSSRDHSRKSSGDRYQKDSSDESSKVPLAPEGSISDQPLINKDESQRFERHSTTSTRKNPMLRAQKNHEGSMSSVEAKSFTSDDTSLARSQIYALNTSPRNDSLRNDSNMKSSSVSSFEASFSSRSYESSSRSHASRSSGAWKKKNSPIPRDASAVSDPSQRASQCSGEESSQSVAFRGPEGDITLKPEKYVDAQVHDELSARKKVDTSTIHPYAVANMEKSDAFAAKRKENITTDYGHDATTIHGSRTIHSLRLLKELGVPLVVQLKEVHVSIHNEGFLHAVEVAYMMLLELRPRIRYMLSLAEWIHIHMLMLYARVYECELAAAKIAQSKDFRIQLPDNVRVLEPLALALASIGIVEDNILGVRYVPVARPLHRKAATHNGHPLPYHPPDPDDVTEFLEWTQYNWNSSWIKVEQAREARKAMAVIDSIQLPEKSFPVNHAKLLEWENVALEKWLGWDESLWYSYEQTVRLVDRKFHFVDFPCDNYNGTYSWLLPLKVVDRTVNTSTSESTTTTDSLVCQVPHLGIGETPEVWMLSLLFNFCALSENQTATWYYETTPVDDVSVRLSKFMQSAIRS